MIPDKERGAMRSGRDLDALGKVIVGVVVAVTVTCGIGLVVAIAAGSWALVKLTWG